MIKMLFRDTKQLLNAYLHQDLVFYLGCAYIILMYMRPQLIYPQLNFLPWVQIVLLLGLFLQVYKKQFKLTFSHNLVFLLALLAVVSGIFSQYPSISERFILDPIIFSVEVLFLSNCVKNRQQLLLLFGLFFLCMLKMSIFGAKVWTLRGFAFADWGISGPPGFFQNSGEFSLLMAITCVASIPFIQATGLKRLFFWILPITAAMTVLGASSRGSQLAMVVGIIYLLLAYKKFKLKNVVVLIVIFYIGYAIFPEEQKQRFQSIGEDGTSVARIQYWSAGLDMTGRFPFLGVGYRAFPEYYHDYYKVHDGSHLSNRRERAHNSIVEVASTIGVPALLIYLMLHWRVFNAAVPKEAFSINRNIHLLRMLRGSIITYFIGALFMSVAFYPYIFLLISWQILIRGQIKNEAT
jgi:O-antigen ligase